MAEVKSVESQQRCTWATSAADLYAAACASALVSPWVAVIDKLVYNRAAKNASITESLQSWMNKPSTSLRSLAIPFLVYFATYATVNCLDSFYAAQNSDDPSTTSTAYTKALAATAVNIGTCVFKDGYYAKTATGMAVPILTYALFTARDAVTMYSSFNLPVLLAPMLPTFPNTTSFLGDCIAKSEQVRLQTAQILVPAAAQIVTTPLHLLGIDIHNRQGKITSRDRVRAVWSHFAFATPLRIMRVLPPYGFGNAVNNSCRTTMLHRMA